LSSEILPPGFSVAGGAFEAAPEARLVVDAETVSAGLAGTELTLVDCRSDDTLPKNYWNICPDQYLLPGIAYMGVTTDTTVVVYGADVTAAARLAWVLMYAGVEDVRLLNGGFKAWQEADYAGQAGAVMRTPASWFGRDEPLHPEYLVGSDYIREVVAGLHPNVVIADIRTRDEYLGCTAPYDYI